jgi:hypothetical protein
MPFAYMVTPKLFRESQQQLNDGQGFQQLAD